MNEFVDLLQKFAFELAVLALPIISGFVIAALRALVKKWLGELEASKPKLYDVLSIAAQMAVAAVEQMELAGFISDKKQEACNIVQAYLNELGWDEVDVSVLEAAIEAEVLRQFPD